MEKIDLQGYARLFESLKKEYWLPINYPIARRTNNQLILLILDIRYADLYLF